MHLFKCCSLLTRTMSPLIVGLIWCYAIEVSSLSHPTQAYFIHPEYAPIIIYSNNASNSSSAKDTVLHRTKLIRDAQRNSDDKLNSSRSIVSNGSTRDVRLTNRRLPKLRLNSTLNVRNSSKVNSTIIYFPRYSRSMGNFSKTYEKHELTPLIVSKKRRVLLDLKEYKTKRSSDALFLFRKINDSSQFRLKTKQKNGENFSTAIQRNFSSKNSELSSQFTEVTTAANTQRVLKPFNLNRQNISRYRTEIRSNKKVTDSKNSSVLQFSPVADKGKENRIFSGINRRRGRTFDASHETSLEEQISLPVYSERINSGFETSTDASKKITASTHYFTPSKNSFYSESSSTSENLEDQSLTDLRYSYTEKKAKNLTIYEILKPRLKNNISEIIDFSSNQNSYSLQNDAVYHQVQDITRVESNDTSINNVHSDEEDTNNNTLVTNEIEDGRSNYEIPLSIIPGRSDSGYGIRYVNINRNNVTTVSSVELNVTNLNNYFELEKNEKDKNNTLAAESAEEIDTDEIYRKVGYVNEAAFLEDILRKMNKDDIVQNIVKNSTETTYNSTTVENLSADGSEYQTQLYESDSIRRPKMSENINNDNTPFKNPKLDSKIFYDYFAKKPTGNLTLRDFPYLEYRPGNMFRYSDIYERKPLLDLLYARPTSIQLQKTDPSFVTEETMVNPTTFNSLRTPVRVLSTFYPNRIQDVTMKFGGRIETTTLPNDQRPEYRNEDDPDDAEYRDNPGFTMEKLAYLLIGTCCGLSILCLFVVVVAIKCRRAIVEKRLKAQFRKRMYQHERMKDVANPWQQQMFDHFMYLNRRPGGSSCSSNTDSCNCRCVTWSLGARNLDATRPLCPPSRSSLYLYGQKRLPFGAASTLRFESMLGRKRSPEHQQKRESPNTDSSHENDSLDFDSDSREGDGPKQCTCIDYNVWPMQPVNVPRGFFTLCPNPARYNVGDCSQHPAVDFRTIARDLPPPVTGSNYLDRSEGVVYWSSNDERLI